MTTYTKRVTNADPFARSLENVGGSDCLVVTMETFNQVTYSSYTEDTTAVSLMADGGVYGGGVKDLDNKRQEIPSQTADAT